MTFPQGERQPSSPLLQISLLGRFKVSIDGVPTGGFEAKKSQELLGYLLLNPRLTHHREVLAGVLWPDHDPAQARQYLRQAIWQLNSSWQPVIENTGIASLLQTNESEWIGLLHPRAMWLDTAILEGAVEKARQSLGGEGLNGYFAEAKYAAATYTGGFLSGHGEQWIQMERQRLQDLYFGLVKTLLSHCAATGRYDEGCEIGIESLRHDMARELSHRWLMRLHYLSGDRVAALRQYQCCESILRKEFGAAPDAETRAIHGHILRAEPLDDAPGAPMAAMSELQRKIAKMECDLDSLQSNVRAYLRPRAASAGAK